MVIYKWKGLPKVGLHVGADVGVLVGDTVGADVGTLGWNRIG